MPHMCYYMSVMNDLSYKNFTFSIRMVPLSDINSAPDLNRNHFHRLYELYFLEKGDVDFYLGDTMYHMHPDDLVIVPPNVYHCAHLKNTNLYQRTVIQFAPSYFNPKLFFELDTLLPYYRISKGSPLFQLITHVKNVVNLYADESERFVCVSQTAYLILTELNRLKSNTVSETSIIQHPLGNVVQYIDNNLHLPLTVESIAHAMFLSASYLSHNFQKYMHMSLKKYINHKKILAADQLIQSGVPIMKAAEKYGFENYSTFYFQYKKILGTSPRPIQDKK